MISLVFASVNGYDFRTQIRVWQVGRWSRAARHRLMADFFTCLGPSLVERARLEQISLFPVRLALRVIALDSKDHSSTG